MSFKVEIISWKIVFKEFSILCDVSHDILLSTCKRDQLCFLLFIMTLVNPTPAVNNECSNS